MKTVCIICAQEKNGLGVKDDWMIGAMRWVKRNITKNPKNYNLVVCKECFLDYKKKRDGYERKQMLYAVLCIIFLVALAITTRLNPGAIVIGLVITLFLQALAQLSYMPPVDIPTTNAKIRK